MNAKCEEAVFHQTRLLNTTLSGAIGLSDVNHEGQSLIDDETLRRSEDLPTNFHKGCGFTSSQLALLEKV